MKLPLALPRPFRQTLRRCAPTLLVLWLAGCGGGGGSDPAPVPPVVTSTSPATSTPTPSGVATSSRIAVTFSKPMAATTAAASVSLACPAGTPISGTSVYDAATQTTTLTPTVVLPAGTLCEARVATTAQDSGGLALAAVYLWRFTTAALADTTRPTLVITAPADLASGVAANTSVTATFSEDMLAATLTNTTFTVFNTTLGTAVPGTVAYTASAKTATFTPSAGSFAGSSQFTATITAAATDLAGNALAGNGAQTWTFSTAASGDTSAPTVAGTSPQAGASAVCVTKIVSVTFSEPVDAASVNTSTFGVTDNGVAVAGSTTYDASSRIATFSTSNAAGFPAGRPLVATVKSGSSGVKDLAGNALAADAQWGFTTGTLACAAGPDLRVVVAFGVFGGTAGVTNEGLDTHIDGNLGSTAACSQVTGLHDPVNAFTQTAQNAGEVNGLVFCAPPLPGTATSAAVAAQVRGEAQAAYAELVALPAGTDPAAGQLGGLVLPPATYTAAAGAFSVTTGDLTLDAQGDPNAVWVFQSAASLTVGLNGTPRNVLLINGARARNVFWQVGSAARIEDGSSLVGTVMVQSGASFSTPGQSLTTTLTGRVTSITGAVSLVNTRIVAP